MPDALELTGEIAEAVDGALERGHPLVVGYVDDSGYPVVSFRGSTHVHGPQQLAICVRKADDGFAKAVTERPQVTLLYYDRDGPGPFYVSFRGRARVDPAADEDVYANTVERERQLDPDRIGVAVIIDVDSVRGAGPGGAFHQERK